MILLLLAGALQLPADTGRVPGAPLVPSGEFAGVAADPGGGHGGDTVTPARGTPRLRMPWTRLGLIRFNRVEGLSIGARVELERWPYDVRLTGRYGIAGEEWGAELEATRFADAHLLQAVAYRRLDDAALRTRSLLPGHSIRAAAFGWDDGDYFRATGAELRGRAAGEARRFIWRVYVERQEPLEKNTDFSLRHLVEEDHGFRENLPAVDADQVGAELTLRLAGGGEETGSRWRAAATLEGAGGSFAFGRASSRASASVVLFGGGLVAAELEGGGAFGDVPPQGLWLLGGGATLRGYPGAAAAGETFWRSRVEAAAPVGSYGFVLFSDVGWAGPGEDLMSGRPLLSAGGGLSTLDGLVRIDVARALRTPTGWRLDVYLGALI